LTSKIADANGTFGRLGLSCRPLAQRSPRMREPIVARAASRRLGYASNDPSPGRRQRLCRCHLGTTHGQHHRRRRQGGVRATRCRSPQWLEPDRDQTWSCRSISAASWVPPDASTPCASSSTAWPTPLPVGACRTGTLPTRFRLTTTAPSSSTCWSSRRCLSTLPSGSTWASRQNQVLGLLHQQRRGHHGVNSRPG